MSFLSKTVALSCAAALLTATAAVAQVGGPDLPGAAKAKAGSSKMTSHKMMKGHTMTKTSSMTHHTMMRSKGKMSGHKTF